MRVYVGGLSSSTEKAEVEREFKKFGSLRDVWVARNPPGFAFLEFEDQRDADVGLRRESTAVEHRLILKY